MNFWIDENIPRQIKSALEQAGHQTFTSPSGSDDYIVLQQALAAAAVLITHDRDFKRYVLRDGWACGGVIWIRPTTVDRRAQLIVKLLHCIENHADTLSTSFISFSLYKTEVISLKE